MKHEISPSSSSSFDLSRYGRRNCRYLRLSNHDPSSEPHYAVVSGAWGGGRLSMYVAKGFVIASKTLRGEAAVFKRRDYGIYRIGRIGASGLFGEVELPRVVGVQEAPLTFAYGKDEGSKSLIVAQGVHLLLNGLGGDESLALAGEVAVAQDRLDQDYVHTQRVISGVSEELDFNP